MNLERQGVDLALELRGQSRIDEAVSLQPRLAGKDRRHDKHAKVALARSGGAAMARMQVRFVHHLKAERAEGLRQLRLDGRCH
jgi:hypothetical protein